MERIKRFLLDDSATAEATSTVVMIAAVGILLAAGLIVWYGRLDSFFDTAGANLENAASDFALPGGS
jgi:hypothetical protein